MCRMVSSSFGYEERAAESLAAYLQQVLTLQRARRCSLFTHTREHATDTPETNFSHSFSVSVRCKRDSFLSVGAPTGT